MNKAVTKEQAAQRSGGADAGRRSSGLEQAMALPLVSGEEPLARKEPAAAKPREAMIKPGRALALTVFAPQSLGAGERLMRLAYRLGVPGSALTSPFRKPVKPRLAATVEIPLPGDRVAGVALRAGHFLVHGVKAPIGQMDFTPTAKLTPPFERTIHGFSWLGDLAASAPREQCTATAERILAAWLEANPRPAKGAAWKVGNAAHRLMSWFVYAPYLLSGPEKTLRVKALSEMENTARWLDRNVGRAENRLAEVTGWAAITAAGLLLPGGRPRFLFGEAGLIRALGELVGDDGGVLSRSPLDQMEAIAVLVNLRACYRAIRSDPPDALEAVLVMLVPPLLALLHGDGGLGNWQGTGAVKASRIAALVEASGVRTRPLREVRQWGYQRVSAGKTLLQFDAAPPPLARHTRSGCASTLAFEMSHDGHRLVVNCGGAAFAGGQIPVRIEQGLRATAAHSTLVLEDANSTAVLINGKLGGGVGEVEVDRRTLDLDAASATRIEASHDGYASRYGLVHRRILITRDDGSELRGEDVLMPVGRKGKRGKVRFAIRFHLGRGIDARLTDNRHGAGLALPDGSFWQFVTGASGVDGIELSIEESLWSDGVGRPHPIQQLVISGMVSRGGGNFSWLFKKMR